MPEAGGDPRMSALLESVQLALKEARLPGVVIAALWLGDKEGVLGGESLTHSSMPPVGLSEDQIASDFHAHTAMLAMIQSRLEEMKRDCVRNFGPIARSAIDGQCQSFIGDLVAVDAERTEIQAAIRDCARTYAPAVVMGATVPQHGVPRNPALPIVDSCRHSVPLQATGEELVYTIAALSNEVDEFTARTAAAEGIDLTVFRNRVADIAKKMRKGLSSTQSRRPPKQL